MENEGFYNKFETLPIEAQKQVLAYIDLLTQHKIIIMHATS